MVKKTSNVTNNKIYNYKCSLVKLTYVKLTSDKKLQITKNSLIKKCKCLSLKKHFENMLIQPNM